LILLFNIFIVDRGFAFSEQEKIDKFAQAHYKN